MGQSTSKDKSNEIDSSDANPLSIQQYALDSPAAKLSRSFIPALAPRTIIHMLADIELQLIMHGLEGRDILSFAHCNRLLMHAADSAFAWKYSILPLRCGCVDLAAVSASSGLLRHAPLALHFSTVGSPISFELVLTLPIWSRVRELHTCDGVSLHHPRWLQLLAHPILKRHILRVCDTSAYRVIPNEECTKLMRILNSLPQLTSLTFSCGPQDPSRWNLSSLHSLTSLSLTDWVGAETHLQLIANCSPIKDLSILRPKLYGSAFRTFFLLPNLLGLQSLTLDLFWANGKRGDSAPDTYMRVSDEDYATVFTALISLRSLSLSRIENIDVMLPHLIHSPSLVHLSIRSLNAVSSVPSASILATLFDVHPHLHVTLLAPRSEEFRVSTVTQANIRLMQSSQLRSYVDRLVMENDRMKDCGVQSSASFVGLSFNQFPRIPSLSASEQLHQPD